MPVSGDLRDMDLASIISINCNEMNQARLLVRHQGREASVFFEGGNIVHMSLGSLEGEGVMQEIVGWKEGTFELEREVPALRRTVTTGWSELLLKGMQRLDEGADLDLAAESPVAISNRDGDDEISHGQLGEDAGAENETDETGVGYDLGLADQASVEPAGAVSELIDAVSELGQPGSGATDLKALAETLFQMGLDNGLSPHEAALQASKIRLPELIAGTPQREFKRWLVEAYQENLRGQVEELRQEIGFEEVADQRKE